MFGDFFWAGRCVGFWSLSLGMTLGFPEIRHLGVPSVNIFPMLEPTVAPDFWHPPPTLTYQNLLFSRFPINSILRIIIGPYKKSRFW